MDLSLRSVRKRAQGYIKLNWCWRFGHLHRLTRPQPVEELMRVKCILCGGFEVFFAEWYPRTVPTVLLVSRWYHVKVCETHFEKDGWARALDDLGTRRSMGEPDATDTGAYSDTLTSS